MTEPLVHYCVVRNDLTRGQMAAQLIHAAGESGPAVDGTFAVALHATPSELVDLQRECLEKEIACAAVTEPCAPWNGELMALGFPPAPRADRRFLQRFPLIR